MATSDRFEKLETLYSAISRIDNTISVEETNNLESVLDVVRDIPKKDFPKEYQDAMISNIRGALVKLYTDEMNTLSSRLGIQMFPEDTPTAPSKPYYIPPIGVPASPMRSPLYIGDPVPGTSPLWENPVFTCTANDDGATTGEKIEEVKS